MDTPHHVVTGAFGYSGSYIASRLLDTGVRVRTITNSLSRPSPLKGRIEAHPFNFDRPERLVDSLRGASVLYNTYWVRFNATGFRHSVAVAQGSSRESVVINAIGPETFTYRSLVETIGEAIGRVRPIVSIPPFVGYGVGWALGHLLGDVVITRPEIEGLMAGPPFRQRTASGHNTALNLGRDTRPPSASTIPVRWSGGVTAEANIAREPDPPCAPSCVDSLAPAGVSS